MDGVGTVSGGDLELAQWAERVAVNGWNQCWNAHDGWNQSWSPPGQDMCIGGWSEHSGCSEWQRSGVGAMGGTSGGEWLE